MFRYKNGVLLLRVAQFLCWARRQCKAQQFSSLKDSCSGSVAEPLLQDLVSSMASRGNDGTFVYYTVLSQPVGMGWVGWKYMFKKKMVVHWIIQSLCVLLSFVSWIIAMEHLTDVFPVLWRFCDFTKRFHNGVPQYMCCLSCIVFCLFVCCCLYFCLFVCLMLFVLFILLVFLFVCLFNVVGFVHFFNVPPYKLIGWSSTMWWQVCKYLVLQLLSNVTLVWTDIKQNIDWLIELLSEKLIAATKGEGTGKIVPQTGKEVEVGRGRVHHSVPCMKLWL